MQTTTSNSQVGKTQKLLILQINGPDRSGLFTKFCDYLYKQRVNIADVSQNVLRGFLAITFLLDMEDALINRDRLELGLKRLAKELRINATVFDYIEGQRSRMRYLYVFTFMGPDQPGILAKLSHILAKKNTNIDTIRTIQRGNWIYAQLFLDLGAVDDHSELRRYLRHECEILDLSMVLQQESIYRKNKKLIVFDMDSTLVRSETIVEIAKRINRHNEIQLATEKAMSTEIDFSSSLKRRTKLLKGVHLETLLDIAINLELTPGVEELIKTLKEMDWKIALISSGFSIFTDAIKNKLDLDYSFGNTLEIVSGEVTGDVIGEIIDDNGKWQIIEDLIDELGISREEVVTVGDGSNDQIMLKKSGLGLGFNSKEIASEVADGRLRPQDINMILLMLGLSDTEIELLLHNSTSGKTSQNNQLEIQREFPKSRREKNE